MINLKDLYPQLNKIQKRKLLSFIADGYTAPYTLNQEVVKMSEKMEELAVQNLIRDYFFYSNNADIVKLRNNIYDSIESIYKNNELYSGFNKIIDYLYQPEYVKLMFESAMTEMCIECGIKRSETIDKSFKFRDNYRRCQQDRKENISPKDSINSVIPVLNNIVDSIYMAVMLEDSHEYNQTM